MLPVIVLIRNREGISALNEETSIKLKTLYSKAFCIVTMRKYTTLQECLHVHYYWFSKKIPAVVTTKSTKRALMVSVRV